MKKSKAARLCILALMIALEIILTRFLSINTMFLRIGFGFLPMAMLGIMYGPLWTAGSYLVADLIASILFPSGPFFPGFTLTAALSGLVFGLVLHKRPVTIKSAFVASLIISLFFNLVLDTLWLSILYGDAFIALLPTRIVKVVLAIPIETVLIPFVWNKIFMKIPEVRAQMR